MGERNAMSVYWQLQIRQCLAMPAIFLWKELGIQGFMSLNSENSYSMVNLEGVKKDLLLQLHWHKERERVQSDTDNSVAKDLRGLGERAKINV